MLSDGFRIENFSIANIKISGLYLKLDKKLILEIAQISIPKKSAESSKDSAKSPDSAPKISDITQVIQYAITLSSFFERLALKQINYDGGKYFVYFDGHTFRVDVPYVLADFSLQNDAGDILLDIKTLKVKSEDLVIKGKILKKGKVFAFDLESYINNREDNFISYQGETNFKYFSIVLDSTRLESIDILAPYIKMLDLDVYEWMFERAKFSAITINRAYLVAKNFDAKNIGKVVADNLYANGTLESVDLNFEGALKNITAPSVDVIFEGGKLKFIVENAKYGDTQNLLNKSVIASEALAERGNPPLKKTAKSSVDSATHTQSAQSQGGLPRLASKSRNDATLISSALVELSDFDAPQTLLSINLNLSQSLLDDNILGILEHYEVGIPLRQLSGKNTGNLTLEVLLPNTEKKLEAEVSAKGEINIADSAIEVLGAKMHIDSAKVVMDGENISAQSPSVSFGEILKSDFQLSANTTKKTIAINATPRKLRIQSGESEIINLSGVPLKASMDLNGEFFAHIAPLDITIDSRKSATTINASLANLLPYAPLLNLLDMKEGNIALKVPQEGAPLTLNANITNLKYPLYYLNNTRVSALNIEGEISKEALNFIDKANKIALKIALEDGDIDLKIDEKFINIDEILSSKIPLFRQMLDNAESRADSAKSTKSPTNLLIEGNKLSLGLFDYKIPFDEAMLKLTKNGFIANGKNKNGIANIILDDGSIQVEANNFNSDFVNGVFNGDFVSGGTFGVFGIYREGRFVGDISAFDTSIKEMATLQNILTFIDAIPSLVVFKLPGFSASGYEIDEASVRVGIDSEYIALENIDIDGSSVDITGNGVVGLKSKDLNIRLELSTIKSLSSILNKIPIIGFLLLGEDGKITTDLTITGTLDAPKTEISLLEDAAKTPLNILKRVFSPFQVLIDELKKENKKRRGAR